MPDLDDVFKFATPKYVYIRDSKLGILKYLFMGIIFFYVVIYSIMYSCTHLKPEVATGLGSMTLNSPVIDCKDGACTFDFDNIADMKYCSQYQKGRLLAAKEKPKPTLSKKDEKTTDDKNASKSEQKGDEKKSDDKSASKPKGPQVGDFQTKPKDCRYIDSDRLTLEEQPNSLFVPMRYVSYEQTINTECYDPLLKGHKGHSVRKTGANYSCKKAWTTTSTKEFFVADIGAYTISISHSFMVPAFGLAGASPQFAGFFAACKDNHPADPWSECKIARVPNTTGKVAPEDEALAVNIKDLGVDSLTGTPEGLDKISIQDLLKLTPVAQDNNWTKDIPDRKLPPSFGHPDNSIRENGGMLMLSIDYANTGYGRPGFPGMDFPVVALGAIKPITYTYRPYFIPTKESKRVEVKQENDASKTRTVNVWYGLSIMMSFEGKIVQFTVSQLLTGLTTGLVLLSSATTIVVSLALYVFKNKEKYLLQMYQFTEDMTEYKSLDLEKCPVTSFTGDKLLDTVVKKRSLNVEEITDILLDYEVRFNRIDGRDPKLAFIGDEIKNKGVQKMRDNQQEKQNAFFQSMGGAVE